MSDTRRLKTPSEVSRRETRFFAWGMAILFLALFLFYALTLEPPLTTGPLLFFAALSLSLAGGYIFLTPRGLSLPRGAGAKVHWQYPLLSASWPIVFFFLLRGRAVVYFYLAAFDEYLSLALFHSRRWAVTWLCALAAEMLFAWVVLLGWSEAVPSFLESLPLYLLVSGLAELVVRLWEERERAEALTGELEEAYRRLQDYTAQAESLAVAQERVRLAHEIHDTLGHTLTALSVQLELLRQLPPERGAEREQALGMARRLSDGAQVEVWRAIRALRPPPLERLSLPEALHQLIEDFARRLGREVAWQVDGQPRPIQESVSLTLYRALQEGLTNVQRHAPEAKRIAVSLRYETTEVILEVENGPSPEPLRSPSPSSSERGFGLHGLQERAESLGGRFYAGPTPEGGFRLEMRLPLPLT
ncbi:MAG: sensor histidine kinase [Anaerolineae bacterium]|nr:MAG: sensor histidine kinase [Anaerolineae bacterium]